MTESTIRRKAHSQPSVRLAELIAALSLATDLGTGLPFEQALRTCLLATRFAAQMGLTEQERCEVYYSAASAAHNQLVERECRQLFGVRTRRMPSTSAIAHLRLYASL